ncbi:metallophosphoesterase [Georgenia sp. 10Sc9-8]|uniref:Metallophosphoesterase n=1 Tax=Georgenia halotolerans TaxID=3028317 RepID=A0ABT5TWI3_9MICO|nr:metallophosphoesterase [Georgenia halotolerans]
MEAGARSVGRAVAGAAVAGLAGVGWALTETRMFALRQAEVPVLAPGSRPVHILHVSDLHLVPGQRRKTAWVRSLGELAPDLVVSTGDHMAHEKAVPAVLEAYQPLLDLPGAFVFGSNDYFGPQPKNPARYLRSDSRQDSDRDEMRRLPSAALAEAFRRSGWTDLTNRRDRLEIAGTDVSLVGVDDPHLDYDEFPDRPDGAENGALHLGVAHAPYQRVLREMHRDHCDLVLAGHTHGGQLRVPGYGALVTNCDLDRGRVSGLHGWPGPRPDEPGGATSTWLHVSAGLGTSPYAPVRFACRPEASLLRLVPRAD